MGTGIHKGSYQALLKASMIPLIHCTSTGTDITGTLISKSGYQTETF